MRSVAFCLPYYLNQGMLDRQIDSIASLPASLRAAMEMIVVDDGSPDKPAPKWRDPGCPFRIYRIGVDIPWNQDAARNIAAHEAQARWLLLTDIDHLVPFNTWRTLDSMKLDKQSVYKFGRRMTLEEDGHKPKVSEYKPHPNSWLMTRSKYWEIGGYDERFAGNYGTDADFRDRIQAVTPILPLALDIWRVPRETIPDASTRTLKRKDPAQGWEIRRIKEARSKLEDQSPLTLQFPYELVACVC